VRRIVHPRNPKARKPIMHRWGHPDGDWERQMQRDDDPEPTPAWMRPDFIRPEATLCPPYAVAPDPRAKNGSPVKLDTGFVMRDGRPVSTYLPQRRQTITLRPDLIEAARLVAIGWRLDREPLVLARDMGTRYAWQIARNPPFTCVLDRSRQQAWEPRPSCGRPESRVRRRCPFRRQDHGRPRASADALGTGDVSKLRLRSQTALAQLRPKM
jgi:hypothetical protein